MRSSISSSDRPRGEGRPFLIAFATALFALTLVLGAASEWLVRTRVMPQTPFYDFARLVKTSQNTNAIFGDSLLAYALSGLDGMVNLAVPGGGFHEMAAMARYYYAERQPDRVILEAAPHYFSALYHRNSQDAAALVEQVRREGDGPVHFLGEVHRAGLFGYWRELLAGGTFLPTHPLRADGSRPSEEVYMPGGTAEASALAHFHARAREPLPGFARSKVAVEYRRLVEDLRNRGASVCLLYTPQVAELAAAESQRPNYAQAHQWYNELAATTGARHVVFDHELPRNQFTDAYHLNREGALAITPEALRRCFD